MKGIISQNVWVMFLARHCLPKVVKNCKKRPKFDFCVNYYTGSDDLGLDNMGTVFVLCI